MEIQLPEAYIEQMKKLLGDEAEAFFKSYQKPRTQGLRLNPSKLSKDSPLFLRLQELFGLVPVPWCETGYYYSETARPGKSPYHAAGLYYIQEPSAMSAAELLDPQLGETVLDLAAAPGGKSTQIAGKLGVTGLLVANEIHPGRAAILSENIERMGYANTIVTNASPDKLAERFPAFFDAVMLDAPCSGEGMFRKDPDAIQEWSPDHVEMCAARQEDIARHALSMLKPGGRLGYSTCTFNRQENEERIEALTTEFPSLTVERVERIWPHEFRGEGHFVAILRKGEEASLRMEGRAGGKSSARSGSLPKPVQEAWQLFRAFTADAFQQELPLPDGTPILFGDQLYWLPQGTAGLFVPRLLEGLKTPRPGIHLAAVKKNRIEPSHALALATAPEDFRSIVSFGADSPEIQSFLRGESLPAPEGTPTGWIPVCVDGYPLGWAKMSSGILKNHYPKGLRG